METDGVAARSAARAVLDDIAALAGSEQLPAPLAAINLQHGLISHRAKQAKTYEAENGPTELRAVTGPDYGRIYDHELVEAVQRIAGNGTGEAAAALVAVAVGIRDEAGRPEPRIDRVVSMTADPGIRTPRVDQRGQVCGEGRAERIAAEAGRDADRVGRVVGAYHTVTVEPPVFHQLVRGLGEGIVSGVGALDRAGVVPLSRYDLDEASPERLGWRRYWNRCPSPGCDLRIGFRGPFRGPSRD